MAKSYFKVRKNAKRLKTDAIGIFITLTGVASAVGLIGSPLAVAAAGSQVVVTPTNTQGWSTADTNSGGTVTYSNDTSAPGNPHNGALQLTTNSTNTARAQYMHAANTPLSNVNELSYYTKQISGPPTADPSYQLPVCLGGVSNGACVGFTTLVYEPYWNGPVTPNTWQKWDVSSPTANLWSSHAYTNGTCAVVNGAGGPPFYSIAELQTACPNAVVVGFGVNVGTYNPGYVVESDLVDFNGTTYNFEPYVAATDKDQCKNGGWAHVTDTQGNSFKNQGSCVSYVASDGRSEH